MSHDFRKHIPRVTQEFANPRIVLGLYCMICPALIFGLVQVHNAWIYLIPTIIGSLLPTLLFLFRPYNPYQSLFARVQGMDSPGRTRSSDCSTSHYFARIAGSKMAVAPNRYCFITDFGRFRLWVFVHPKATIAMVISHGSNTNHYVYLWTSVCRYSSSFPPPVDFSSLGG